MKQIANKLEITKDAIVTLLEACGPCDFGWIAREVRDQAYISKLPLAINQLLFDGVIIIDPEEEARDVFDINYQ